jgi:hypothetical protein
MSAPLQVERYPGPGPRGTGIVQAYIEDSEGGAVGAVVAWNDGSISWTALDNIRWLSRPAHDMDITPCPKAPSDPHEEQGE